MSAPTRPRPRARARTSQQQTDSVAAGGGPIASTSSIGPARNSITPPRKRVLENDDMFAERRMIYRSFGQRKTESPPSDPEAVKRTRTPSRGVQLGLQRKMGLADVEEEGKVASGSGLSRADKDDEKGEIVAGIGRKLRGSKPPERETSLTPPPPIDRFQRDLARASILQSRSLAAGAYNPLDPQNTNGGRYAMGLNGADMSLEEEKDDEMEDKAEDAVKEQRLEALLAQSRARVALRKASMDTFDDDLDGMLDTIVAGATKSGVKPTVGSAPLSVAGIHPHLAPPGWKASTTADFVDQSGGSVSLTVGMKVDTVSVVGKSRIAIEVYEKRKVFRLKPTETLETIYEAMAARTGKQMNEIVLVYRGSKIRSTRFSPAQLGIYGEAELDAYEAAVWEIVQARTRAEEQMKARKLAEEDRLSSRGASPGLSAPVAPVPRQPNNTRSTNKIATVQVVNLVDEDEDDEDFEIIETAGPLFAGKASPENNVDPARSVTPPPKTNEGDGSDVMRLTLRGDEGDLRVMAKPTTKVSSLLAHYARKKLGKTLSVLQPSGPTEKRRGRKPSRPPPAPITDPDTVSLHMVLEGDRLAPESELQECDEIEDETMLEVKRVG